MELKESQKKHLRSLAHNLNPVVMVGQHGLKDTILAEIDQALEYHQLIKVKLSVGDRELRDEIITTITEHANALLIQRIGNIAILYKENRDRPSVFSL